VTDRQTDKQTNRQTDHATRSVTIGRMYVRSTAMWPKTGTTSTIQHWSGIFYGNRLPSSAESANLEHTLRNGYVRHQTRHTMMIMMTSTKFRKLLRVRTGSPVGRDPAIYGGDALWNTWVLSLKWTCYTASIIV